jgi:hypothetical protein
MMPEVKIDIPLDAPCIFGVRLFYLREHRFPFADSGDLYYLQAIRSGALRLTSANPEEHPKAVSYHKSKTKYGRELANLTRAFQPEFVLAPPSNRSDALFYLAEVRVTHPSATDLTANFSRTPGVTAGQTGTTLESLKSALHFQKPPRLLQGPVLIVDDVLSSGRTTAAIIDCLRQAGLPDSALVGVAAPLLVEKAHEVA